MFRRDRKKIVFTQPGPFSEVRIGCDPTWAISTYIRISTPEPDIQAEGYAGGSRKFPNGCTERMIYAADVHSLSETPIPHKGMIWAAPYTRRIQLFS